MKAKSVRTTFLLFFSLFISSKTYSQAPVVDFSSSDPTGCAPYQVTFTDFSTNNPVSWDWDFGDGSPHESGPNSQHIYQMPGTYTVTHIASNASGSNSITKVGFVRAYQGPTANYTMSEDTVCPGTPISFTDASITGDTIITGYSWNFNDGSSPVSTNPAIHSFTNNGSVISYYVPVFIATDAFGCNSISSHDTVYVLTAPDASFTVSTGSGSFPATVNFINTSTNPQFCTWDFGDPSSGSNNTSNLTNPSHTYAVQGNYIVILNNGVSGCNALFTMNIDSALWATLLKIDEPNRNSLRIFPNPSNERLKIYSNELVENYCVYNSIGEMLVMKNIRENNFEIETSDLPTGLYSFKYYSNKNYHLTNFMVIH